MKKFGFLNSSEEEEISSLITDFERRTGAEFTIAIAKKSDPYPAATLRFSIFVTFALAFIMSISFHFSDALILLTGMFITFLLLTPIGRLNFFKKFFIAKIETDRETDEKAIEVFHQMIKAKTTHNRNILLYISLFERKLKILFDEKIQEKLSNEKSAEIIEMIGNEFSQKHFYEGLIKAITVLEENLASHMESFQTPLLDQHENKILWLDF